MKITIGKFYFKKTNCYKNKAMIGEKNNNVLKILQVPNYRSDESALESIKNQDNLEDVSLDWFKTNYSEYPRMSEKHSTLFESIFMDVIDFNYINFSDYNYYDIDKEGNVFYIEKNKISKLIEKGIIKDFTFTSDIPKDCFTKTKIGRFLKNNVLSPLQDSEIERIQDEVRALLSFDDSMKIEIVKGEDIRKYYHENNYDDKFSKQCKELFNSCMRHTSCQEFMDVYVDNCEMIVLKEKNSEKICGRTILWTDVEGNKISDRIYSSAIGKGVIKKFLEENKIKSSYYNNNEQYLININKLYEKLPYMDSFSCEMSENIEGIETFYLSNRSNTMAMCDKYGLNLEFSRTDLQDTDGNELKICEDCGHVINNSDAMYVENHGYVCGNCEDNYVWINDYEIYVSRDRVSICDKCGDYYITEDGVSLGKHDYCYSCHSESLIPVGKSGLETVSCLEENFNDNYIIDSDGYAYSVEDYEKLTEELDES